MAIKYRVVDLRETLQDSLDVVIENAKSPEDAASRALGLDVVRSGARKDLVAKVYWQPIGTPPNMVRLYRKAVDRPAEQI